MVIFEYSNTEAVSNNSVRMRLEAEAALARSKKFIARAREKHPTRTLRIGGMIVECSESRVQEIKQYCDNNKLTIDYEHSRKSI